MKPIVLCFSGFDPTGGAGIQADIEAINANNAQAMGVLTAITAQNTSEIVQFTPVNKQLISLQANTILTEFQPKVFKLGMLANSEVVEAILTIISKYPNVPVVLDPVLKSSSKNSLSEDNLIKAMEAIIPLTKLITPNQSELDALGGLDSLFKLGAKNVLLTTTDSSKTDNITHYWHQPQKTTKFHCKRLPHKYHGSGCTLASSISANLARGLNLAQAIKQGLDYTWHSLANATVSNNPQLIPNRT